MTIQDCADSIVTRLFSVMWGTDSEQMGDRIAIKVKCDSGEADLGGRNVASARECVEEELRAWLQSMDDPEQNVQSLPPADE